MKVQRGFGFYLIFLILSLISSSFINAQKKGLPGDDSLLKIYVNKFSAAAYQSLNEKDADRKYIVTGTNLKVLINALDSLKNVQIIYKDWPSHSLVIKTSAKTVRQKLAGLNEILFFDLPQQARPEVGIIGYDRSFH